MLYQRIGRQIREQRKRKNLTQERLAERAGISLSFLGHIERGSRKLSVDTLYKICAVLDCSADELLGTGRSDVRISAAEILKQALYLAENENT